MITSYVVLVSTIADAFGNNIKILYNIIRKLVALAVMCYRHRGPNL